MHKFILLFLFLTQVAFSQNSEFFKDFIRPEEINQVNKTIQYSDFDFSQLWLNTPAQYTFGIIGEEHQRIRVKILTVTKSKEDPTLYDVTGKSDVMGNVCDFSGTIKLLEIKELMVMDGKNTSLEEKNEDGIQGILYGKYEFRENPEQKHVGIFKGELYSLWILNPTDQIIYNDLRKVSDSYFNNAYTGIWKGYDGNDIRTCIWSDYRIPGVNNDFDCGTAEFLPAEKYYKKGWENYIKAYRDNDKDAIQEEEREWWK